MNDQIQEIQRGCVEVIGLDNLKNKLASGKPLIVKLGLDPTAADIHLGHTVVMNKLRAFQRMGHQVIFLIGDFTTRIGDPSGRNAMRRPLTLDQIKNNSKTYIDQAFKVLDPALTEVRYNSSWMESQSAGDLIKLASLQTVARMLERDDFEKRYKQQQPIGIHEFIYPLLQGYDSVVLEADVELGGSDQKFNLLMGRELQKHWGQKPQTVLMMPLLVGLDGVKKMSKSANNYIGINDTASEMFGKIMSLPDELMWHYYDLLSFQSIETIDCYQQAVAAGANPRDYKVKLGIEITARFHGEETARAAYNDFIARFKNRVVPGDLREQVIKAPDGVLGVAYILKYSGLVKSTSEAFRMIKQGAVRIDGEQMFDSKRLQSVGSSHVYQVGRRKAAKVLLKND